MSDQPEEKTKAGFTSRWFGWLARTDRASHGYVPFFGWLFLLFGGIWFPATTALNHIFNDSAAPVGVLFGTAIDSNETAKADESEEGETSGADGNATAGNESDSEVAAANGENGSDPESGGANDEDLAAGSGLPAKVKTAAVSTEKRTPPKIGVGTALIILPFCLIFWAWTNIGLLCLMASAMGEVNRCAEENILEKTDYRMACTRAFFVYLFVLLNEVAVVGSLTAGAEIQGTYTRIAILASLLSFVASYRPNFYLGLVGRFSASHETNNGPAESQVNGNAAVSQEQTQSSTTSESVDPDAAESPEEGLAPLKKDRELEEA